MRIHKELVQIVRGTLRNIDDSYTHLRMRDEHDARTSMESVVNGDDLDFWMLLRIGIHPAHGAESDHLGGTEFLEQSLPVDGLAAPEMHGRPPDEVPLLHVIAEVIPDTVCLSRPLHFFPDADFFHFSPFASCHILKSPMGFSGGLMLAIQSIPDNAAPRSLSAFVSSVIRFLSSSSVPYIKMLPAFFLGIESDGIAKNI